MNGGAAPFVIGFASGVVASFVTAYVIAPDLAEKATRKAILNLRNNRDLSAIPVGILQGVANIVGPVVREETRKALTP